MYEQEKAIAIDRIAEDVCNAAYDNGSPQVLGHILFQRLKAAVSRGETASEALSATGAKKSVEDALQASIADTTFRDAVRALRRVMNGCRPPGVTIEDGDGSACATTARFGDVSHLVVVRMPLRGRHDSLLWLEVAFEPSEERSPAPTMVVSRAPSRIIDVPQTALAPQRLRTAGRYVSALPQDVSDNLHDILENVSHAARVFSGNTHAGDLLHAYLQEISMELKRASTLWALGEIDTSADDASLLTGCVQRMGQGHELIGLTVWDDAREWWSSPLGIAFRNANRLAASQGAQIRRVFALSKNESPASEAERLAQIETQQEIGVDVRVIEPDDAVDDSLLAGVRSQCVLRAPGAANAPVGWMTHTAAYDQFNMLVNMFRINPNIVRESERVFERLWRIAKEPERGGRPTARRKKQAVAQG